MANSTRDKARIKLQQAIDGIDKPAEYLLWFCDQYTDQHPELALHASAIVQAMLDTKKAINFLRDII